MNGLYGTSCGYTDKCLEKGSSDYFSVYFKIVLTIFHFSIGPWTRRIARAIQKERKVYLWDAPRIKETSARFENMVALELYRAVTAWNDMGHGTQYTLVAPAYQWLSNLP